MNKISRVMIFCLLTLLSETLFSPCFSAERGFYLSTDVGYSVADYDSLTLRNGVHQQSAKDSGVASQFNFGYGFWGLSSAEIGVVYFHKVIFNGLNVIPSYRNNIKHNLVYLAGRIGIPTGSRWWPYVKVGVGYVARDSLTALNGQGRAVSALPEGEFFVPVYGLGLYYRAGKHWVLDGTWVGAPGRAQQELPASNFYGIGVIYWFL